MFVVGADLRPWKVEAKSWQVGGGQLSSERDPGHLSCPRD